MPEHWQYNDGGRSDHFKGETRDCVTRAIAIATGKPYIEIYNDLIELAKRERPRGRKKRSHPRTGVHIPTLRRYMDILGWTWVPTMQVGSGTKVHLRADELPPGRLVVSCSKHEVAVIDGVIQDIFDPSRDGTRCVYGYYVQS